MFKKYQERKRKKQELSETRKMELEFYGKKREERKKEHEVKSY